MNVRMNAFAYEGLAFIDEAQDGAMAGTRVRPGDVLLNITGASIGRVCMVPEEICPANVNQHVCIIRSDGRLLPEWISLYLSQPDFQKRILGEQAGATRQALTKEMIEAFDVPSPQLDLQHRIASRLKEQMAAAEDSRQRVSDLLGVMPRIQSATLRECFSSLDAEHGSRNRLDEVLSLRREVVHPRDDPSGAATFVGLEHIASRTGERIGGESVQMEKLTGRKPRFRTGDIVYGYLRPYLNKVWLAEFDGLCSVDQYVYRVNVEVADPEYVAWFMRSPLFLQRAPIDLSPGQLPRLRTDEVAAVTLPLPHLATQRGIAARLRDQFANLHQLNSALTAQLDALEALPAAYLREAFGGLID